MVINGDADVITIAVTATTAVVSRETANAVLAVVSIVAANDVVTFIFTVGISNTVENAILILVAANIVDAGFNCIVGSAE